MSKNNIGYITKKYLSEFTDTLSLNKMEEKIKNKTADPRMQNVSALYIYVNEISLNKYKHENLNGTFIEFSNMVEIFTKKAKLNSEKRTLIFEDEKTFKDFTKFAKENNLNKEYVKICRNIFVKLNEGKTRDELKEKFRVKLEKFIDEEKISYQTFSNHVLDSIVDTGNLYKFIKKKEYDKISMNKILDIRNKLEDNV